MFDKLTDTCLISSRFFSYSWSPASAAMIAPKFPYQGRLRFLLGEFSCEFSCERRLMGPLSLWL